MIVIRFFDKLFTVVKERTCNWDSIVGVYLLLVPTIYNLTSHLKYSYRNLTTKKPDRNNKNKLITLHMSQIIIPQKVLLLFSKIAVGRLNYLHIVTTELVDFVDQLSVSRYIRQSDTNHQHVFFSLTPGVSGPSLPDHTMGLIGRSTYYAQTQ